MKKTRQKKLGEAGLAQHRAKTAQNKLSQVSRKGNFYFQTVNKSNAGIKYKGIYTLNYENGLIGAKAEAKERYEDRIDNRAEISGKRRKTADGMARHSKGIQFPVNEKLADGRHRYYLVGGELVDRLA